MQNLRSFQHQCLEEQQNISADDLLRCLDCGRVLGFGGIANRVRPKSMERDKVKGRDQQ